MKVTATWRRHVVLKDGAKVGGLLGLEIFLINSTMLKYIAKVVKEEEDITIIRDLSLNPEQRNNRSRILKF